MKRKVHNILVMSVFFIFYLLFLKFKMCQAEKMEIHSKILVEAAYPSCTFSNYSKYCYAIYFYLFILLFRCLLKSVTFYVHSSVQRSVEEIKNLSSTEMNLTQHCLQKNPKSYAAWHHRCWVMEFNPEADWKKELKLCGYFLSEDERNFHCWDYRRIVAKKCEVSPAEELDYSTELIESNFSNYSAWHYRSTLLPVVFPCSAKGSLAEDVLLKELDIVQNAAFTDPDDQSVWFYHRWLLGRNKLPLNILNVAVLKPQRIVAVLLSEPKKIDNQCLKLQIDENSMDVSWKTVSPHIPVSSVWVCSLPDNVDINTVNNIYVELEKGEVETALSCSLNGDKCFAWNMSGRAGAFRSEISAATKEVLERELESCQQLLELEPDSKWTLFTCILLMRAVGDVKFQDKIQEYMGHLKEIDTARKNYYNDLESKNVIEDYVETLPLDANGVNLSNKHLSCLHHFDQFILIETINLSNNHLTSVFPLCHLISAKEIILDSNLLKNFNGIELLQNLKVLSAKQNLLESASSLEDLKNCTNLEELYIEDNPIAKDPSSEYLSVLKKLPVLKITDVTVH